MKRIRPCIGISQCLTNSIVRYDAKSQFNEYLIDELSGHFDLVPICPEVECGLGVPRQPVELVATTEGLKVLGRDNKNLDVTNSLLAYAQNKVLSLAHLSGYVFKARSPSCGVMSTPVYNSAGEINQYSNGVFAEALVTHYPDMPVIDDADIYNQEKLNHFINAVQRKTQV